ncbi:hypothetical protein FRC17_006422, partial [Serendipita sp. 399]
LGDSSEYSFPDGTKPKYDVKSGRIDRQEETETKNQHSGILKALEVEGFLAKLRAKVALPQPSFLGRLKGRLEFTHKLSCEGDLLW